MRRARPGVQVVVGARRRVRHRRHRHDGDHVVPVLPGLPAQLELRAVDRARAVHPVRRRSTCRSSRRTPRRSRPAAGSRSRSASACSSIMTTWWRGRHELSKTMETGTIPDEMFLQDIGETPLPRVAGTAVFMSSGTDGMPNVLLHHVKHNKVLHKQVVLLSVMTENVPFAVGNTSLQVARSATRTPRARTRPRLLPRDRARRLHAAAERPARSSTAARSRAWSSTRPTRPTTSAARRCSPPARRRSRAGARCCSRSSRATRARRRRSSTCRRTASSSSASRSSSSLRLELFFLELALRAHGSRRR